MARNTVTLTDTYQQIAATAASIRVQSADGKAVIAFNETATDLHAFTDRASPGDQYAQTEGKATYARLTSGAAVLLVDEEG